MPKHDGKAQSVAPLKPGKIHASRGMQWANNFMACSRFHFISVILLVFRFFVCWDLCVVSLLGQGEHRHRSSLLCWWSVFCVCLCIYVLRLYERIPSCGSFFFIAKAWAVFVHLARKRFVSKNVSMLYIHTVHSIYRICFMAHTGIRLRLRRRVLEKIHYYYYRTTLCMLYGLRCTFRVLHPIYKCV